MVNYQYMRINLKDIPNKVIVEYSLPPLADSSGYVYVEIRKGMYGLKEAGIVAYKRLVRKIQPHGYAPVVHTPGLHPRCGRLRYQVLRQRRRYPPPRRPPRKLLNHCRPIWQQVLRPDHQMELPRKLCQHLHAQLCPQIPGALPSPHAHAPPTLSPQVACANVRGQGAILP